MAEYRDHRQTALRQASLLRHCRQLPNLLHLVGRSGLVGSSLQRGLWPTATSSADLMDQPLKVLCELGGWKTSRTIFECYQRADQTRLKEVLEQRRRTHG